MKTRLIKNYPIALVFLMVLPLHAQQFGYGKEVAGDLQSVPASTVVDEVSLRKIALDLSIGHAGNLDAVSRYIWAHPNLLNITKTAFEQAVISAAQDKQVGSNPTSVGSTSLVSKGVAALLGVALEDGSISRSTSGSTTTITANIPQVVSLISGQERQVCQIIKQQGGCSPAAKLLEGASIALAFNTSSASDTNTTLSATALSALTGTTNPVFGGLTAREDFHVRKNDIDQNAFATALLKNPTLQTAAITYLTAAGTVDNSISGDPAYIKAFNDCRDSITQLPKAQAQAELNGLLTTCEANIAKAVVGVPGATDNLTALSNARDAYLTARTAALDQVFNRTSFSVEYDLANVLNQPTQSTYKFISSSRIPRPDGRLIQLTANGSATMYNSLQGSSVSRFRSAQAAVQLDATLTKGASALQVAFSGGYYFQYMIANGLLTLPTTALAPGTAIPLPGNASELLNTTGPIHIGQGKMTLSIKGTNISLPLALTFASRTDLIKATNVRGNFGITYNFDSLLAK